MKQIFYILLITLASCNSTSKSDIKHKKKQRLTLFKPCTKESQKEDLTENERYLNTRNKLVPFKFTSEIKRTNDSNIKLPINIEEEYGVINPDFALLDFNKDGYDDLFFEYYGIAGTGEKNIIDIYFFDPIENRYSDSCFSITNPSFFFDKDIITSYYYGLGGGRATKYQIINEKLELIECIEIDINSSDTFRATFWYSQKPFSDTLKYNDNMVRLPEEYKYRRVIKENIN